jgi:hypothetical protein
MLDCSQVCGATWGTGTEVDSVGAIGGTAPAAGAALEAKSPNSATVDGGTTCGRAAGAEGERDMLPLVVAGTWSGRGKPAVLAPVGSDIESVAAWRRAGTTSE